MSDKDSIPIETRELRGPWRWVASVVAGLLALGVVGGLLYFRSSAYGPKEAAVGSVTTSGVDFSCRLPVLAGAAGAFISFPSGAVTIDHRVALDLYKGGYGYTYDAQAGKWVPVTRSAISPDGRSYAYMAQTTGVPGEMSTSSLHTREIASGKDRVLWQGSGSAMGPDVTWLPSGIYFSAVLFPATGAADPMFPALYVADPNNSGQPRRVGPNPPPQPPSPGQPYFSGPDIFTIVGGGAAWGMGNRTPTEATSPDKAPVPGTFGPDRVLRMDLRDGKVSTWYTVTGTELVSVLGLDEQGRPIVALFQPNLKTGPVPADGPPSPRLLLLMSVNQTVEITPGNPEFRLASSPWADSHGIWFGSWNSLWLYTQRGGLRQVATIPVGLFPSPSLPPGYPPKGAIASDARSGIPSYMQGTMVTPAGSCA